jgi:hypothetical protein
MQTGGYDCKAWVMWLVNEVAVNAVQDHVWGSLRWVVGAIRFRYVLEVLGIHVEGDSGDDRVPRVVERLVLGVSPGFEPCKHVLVFAGAK